MNEHERAPQTRVTLPTPPSESFGDTAVREGKLSEWLEFANTEFAKIWLKAKAERSRILSMITEELTGRPDTSAQRDLKPYDLLRNGQVDEKAYESSPQLRLYLSHHLGGLKRYLESSARHDEDREKLEQLTSSHEDMLNKILEADFKHAAKGFMDKDDFPNSPYSNEEELVEKMMSMVDRSI